MAFKTNFQLSYLIVGNFKLDLVSDLLIVGWKAHHSCFFTELKTTKCFQKDVNDLCC